MLRATRAIDLPTSVRSLRGGGMEAAPPVRGVRLRESLDDPWGFSDRAATAGTGVERIRERLAAAPGEATRACLPCATIRETARNPFDYGDDPA